MAAAFRVAGDAQEASLLAGLRAGDDTAYRALVERFEPSLLGLARRILRNDEDARDCVQDTFVSAFRRISSFEERSKLSTWLTRIATNACLMKLRARGRRPEDLASPGLAIFERVGLLAGPVSAGSAAADELLVRECERGRVRDAIAALPEIHRSVLRLRDLEDNDTETTAALLGVRVETAKTRLHRARRALRAELEHGAR